MPEPSVPQKITWQEQLHRLRKGIKNVAPFALGVLAALIALLLYRALFPADPQLTMRQMSDTVNQVLASATPPPAYSSYAFQVIQPSLVLIQAKSNGEDDEENGSLGSGVVVTDRGEILTSLHVVEDAEEILLTFADGSQVKGEIMVKQPENDIAVLQPNQIPELVVPAVLGNLNTMRVGDEAYAVGNPFGLYGSMSSGVISGFDRSFRPQDRDQMLHGLIQIDAAVNPGNSGGPLLNRNGQVIGIVTGIINPTEENFFVGVGFAVPIGVAVGGIGSPPY